MTSIDDLIALVRTVATGDYILPADHNSLRDVAIGISTFLKTTGALPTFPGSQGYILTTTNTQIKWLIPGTSGSLLFLGAGTPPELSWLLPGADGYVLTMVSGLPAWKSFAGGGVGGSGTVNYLPKFTGTSTLGNSVMRETGGIIIVNGSIYGLSDIDAVGAMGAAQAYFGWTDLLVSSPPNNPVADYVRLFVKTDRKLYYKDSSGIEIGPLGPGGGGGGVGGSGTVNYIPKWSATTTLANSVMRESAGVIIVSGSVYALSNINAVGAMGGAYASFGWNDLLIGVAPNNPTANFVRLYAKSDNRLYYRDVNGTEIGPLGTGGGGGGIGGSGTANRFAMFTAPTTIGNAPLFIDTGITGNPIRSQTYFWRFEKRPLMLFNEASSVTPSPTPSLYFTSLYTKSTLIKATNETLLEMGSDGIEYAFARVDTNQLGHAKQSFAFFVEQSPSQNESSVLFPAKPLTFDPVTQKVYYNGRELATL